MAQTFEIYRNPEGQQVQVPIGASSDILSNLTNLGYVKIQPEISSEIPAATDDLDTRESALLAEKEELKKQRKAETERFIASLEAQRAEEKTKQEQINRQLLEATRIIGFRTGRQKYAPDIQVGILSAEESAGLQRLRDIDTAFNNAISKAQQAELDKDWETVNEELKEVRDLQKTALREYANIIKETNKKNEEIEKIKIQAQKDLIIGNTFKLVGSENLMEILNEAQKTNPEITADDVGKYYSNIVSKAKEPERGVEWNQYASFAIQKGEKPTEEGFLNYIRRKGEAGRKTEEIELKPTEGFFDSKIESSIREDFVKLENAYKNPINPTQEELDRTYQTLRKLYSPQEASDEALRNLIGLKAPNEIEELPENQTAQKAASSWLGTLIKSGLSALGQRLFGESPERVRFIELDKKFRRGETLTEEEMKEYKKFLEKQK